MPVQVGLRDLRKNFKGSLALDGVSLDLEPGQITSLLGPSGCGKSTTLRIIAGFEHADDGQVLFDGDVMNARPPNKRNVGIVFQNYCLFPHMTVAENVAFGLRMRKMTRAETYERTTRIIDMVRLNGLEERRPGQLSGGQQQRVALARALVISPAVLLLDEPLGALDKNLRESMQLELKRIQRQLGPTTIIVTHDQEEALTLSSRVAVMREGRILQYGEPKSVYNHPRSRFVAEFLGAANLFEGRVSETLEGGRARVSLNGKNSLAFLVAHPSTVTVQIGQQVRYALRPERIALASELPKSENCFRARLTDSVFRGQSKLYEAQLPGHAAPLQIVSSADYGTSSTLAPGAEVWVHWPAEAMVLLEPDEPNNVFTRRAHNVH